MCESMMAADSSKFPAWFIIFLLFLHLFGASSSVEGNNVTHPCVDGTYEHDGRNCCWCGAGLYLENEQHCTTNLQYGTCKSCGPNTYSSQPNNEKSCEPCTPCSHPNANLEVDEPCTRARDTKCRCKNDHYCSSGTDPCRICNPCKECAEGLEVKAACTATNNTVCSDKPEGGNHVGIIVACVLFICLLCFGVVFAIRWRKRQSRWRPNNQLPNVIAADVEMQPLRVPAVELQSHLPDIAEVIGWKDMKEVALRSNISSPTIESCQLDHPGDSREQTLQLLTIWQEQQGREASQKLIQILETCSKRAKAEEVKNIILKPNLT